MHNVDSTLEKNLKRNWSKNVQWGVGSSCYKKIIKSAKIFDSLPKLGLNFQSKIPQECVEMSS
jgi:hypothetical protein